jgi:hypothetical protein
VTDRENQVTARVHSVASVGAISSPTRALSSVDFPDFNVPASATRNGSSSRRSQAANSSSTSALILRSADSSLRASRMSSRASSTMLITAPRHGRAAGAAH